MSTYYNLHASNVPRPLEKTYTSLSSSDQGFSRSGLLLRSLKQQLLNSTYKTDAIVNILSPLIDIPDYNDEVNQYGQKICYLSDQSAYEIIDLCIDDLRQLMMDVGYRDYDNQRIYLTITTLDGGSVQFCTYMQYNDYAVYLVDSQGRLLEFLHKYDSHAHQRWICYLLPYNNVADRAIYLPDLLDQLISSSSFQNILHDSVVIKDNLTDTYDLSSILAMYKSGKDQVDTLVNQLISTAAVSGIFGVLHVINGIYQSPQAMVVDQDTSLIEFADEDSYIPKSFMVGVLTTAASTALTVLGAIVAACNVIAGILTTLVGIGIDLVKKIMSVESMTRARYVDQPTALLYYPVSIYRLQTGHGSYPSEYTETQQREIKELHNPYLVHSYCAWHILSSNDLDVRYNSFIDCIDRRGSVKTTGIYTKSAHQSGQTPTLWDYDYTIDISKVRSVAKSNTGSSYTLYDEDGEAYLSTASDLTLRKIIAYNIFLFMVSSCNLSESENLTNLVITTGITGGGMINGYSDSSWNVSSTTAYAVAGIFAWIMKDLDDSETDYSDDWISWTKLYQALSGIHSEGMRGPGGASPLLARFPSVVKELFLQADYYTYFDVSCHSSLVPPNYDYNEVIGSIALLASAATIAIATTAIVSVSAGKAIRKKKAVLTADAYRKYDAFVDDPSDENYKAYRTAVMKNNLFSTAFGGTKFSRIGIWDDITDSTSSTGPVSKILNIAKDLQVKSEPTISTVLKVITGVTYS